MNNIDKKKMRKVLYVYIAIILVLIFTSRTIYNISLPTVTLAMTQSGVLTKELEARAVVEFSQTYDIIAPVSGWIEDLFIREGDLTDETHTAAVISINAETHETQLAFDVERAENRVNALIANRREILNASVNLRQYQQAAKDAAANIENLRAAQEREQANAAREYNRLTAEMHSAQSAFFTAEINFDDFPYQQAITEAEIILERKLAELESAETALESATNVSQTAFDDAVYQAAINAATAAHERSIVNYSEAQQRHEAAWRYLNSLYATEASEEEIMLARTAADEAQNQVTLMQIAKDETNNALTHAQNNMRNAQNTREQQNREEREQAVTQAQEKLTQAQHAVQDAAFAYQNAQTTLTRATNAAISEALETLNAATNALDNAAWQAEQDAAQDEKDLSEAFLNLARAEENLADAQKNANTLQSQQLQTINTEIAQAQTDLRAAQAMHEAARTENTINILARQQGTIIKIQARRGQYVSRGDIIATVGVSNKFLMEFTTSTQEANFIEQGDTANITNYSVTAITERITPTGDSVTIRLIAETDRFTGGEYVTIRFTKQTGPHEAIVPTEAIFRGDMGQHYVWTIHSRQGTLGTEYYSAKVNVFISDTDGFQTAISRGLYQGQPVITGFSKDLSTNSRVRRAEL